MNRSFALAVCLAAPAALLAAPIRPANPLVSLPSGSTASPAPTPITGIVADPTGAIVPGAQINLVDASGAVAETSHAGGDGSFVLQPPRAGNYTLVISEPGFDTAKLPVVVNAPLAATSPAATKPFASAAPLHVTLAIATASTNVQVNASSSEDLTATDDNHDTSKMTASDLKQLPIFDNDYATAMSAFMDSSATMTGGAGLIVDGVESDRATVSASAIQEVRINQDPYSAQYYWPGRGQMEIITKSASDHYHGQFNFYFRDNSMNAQNALAPSKPFDQRRTYEGHLTGPVFFWKNSGFLGSFNRAEEDANAVIDANIAPTPQNPSGILQENYPAPNRDSEFSTRLSHKFSDTESAYAQYSYQEETSKNSGIGGQTLPDAGWNSETHEDDFTIHVDSTLSPTMINQFSVVGEHSQNGNVNTAEGPRINVNGYYTGGSGQNDDFFTTYNFRLFDMATWTHGHHFIKMGIGVPNFARKSMDDNTNALGTYSFAPTLDANGNVLETALQNYADNRPSGYSAGYGDTHFIFHQQEMGAFIQDQIKVTDRFSITPGIRYDWQNFLAQKRLGFSPRVSFAYVLDQDSRMVLRGGGGIYYDRFGSGPILDLVRYEGDEPRKRTVSLSLDPANQTSEGCYPISNCYDITTLPVNRVELADNARLPYQTQYGLSLERGLGEKATVTVSGYAVREIGVFRSVDVNAPTPESDYTIRPDPDYLRIRQMQAAGFMEGDGMDVSYEGRFNKWFSGWGRYTWSHFASNSGGIGWFPQNQYDPNDEWSNTGWDRRNRLGFYGVFNPRSVFNLSGGIFANSGTPWTISTGTDPYGDDLFNARPDGVAPYTETMPPYVDMDLRWGHDFAITADKDDESPHVGFSASAFNVLNHPNVSGVDTTEYTPGFGEATSYNPPRRIQLGMRLEF